jgi:hypothetical protein
MNDEALRIIQSEAKLVKSQPVEVTQTKAGSHEAIPPNGSLFIIPLCFVIIWAIATFPFFRELSKSSPRGKLFLQASRIPCRNCRFYSKNSYLKCAVHPTTAATDEAMNCSDFCMKENDINHSKR